MTVFKTFLKLVNKNKGQLILYTVLLITFTCITISSDNANMNYVDVKPDVIIVDNDNTKLSRHLKKYFKDNANVKENVDNVEDELFYRFSSYVIYIPGGFEGSVINGNIKEIEYKSVDDYGSSLASILLNKYLSLLDIYNERDVDDLILKMDSSLKTNTKVELSSSLDTDKLSKAEFYYSFMNYSLLAGCIYTLVVIISIFREKNILKRNIISSMNYNKLNKQLLLSSLLFGIIIWLIYVLLSFIIVGKVMLTANGLCIIALSFIFLLYCLAIGFLVANLISNKNAISGIINVISLGTSFLCGSFVRLEFLPANVLKISKFIPNYYYIDAIDKLVGIEKISLVTLKPILLNVVVLVITTIVFILVAGIISLKKRKIA